MLFPQPDGPIMAVIAFRFTSADTFFTAYLSSPYEIERSMIDKTGFGMCNILSFMNAIVILFCKFQLNFIEIRFAMILSVKTKAIKKSEEDQTRSIIFGLL